MVDGTQAVVLTPQDADVVRGETLQAATQSTVAALTRAIAETREARDRSRVARALAYTTAATLVFVGLCAGMVWLRRKLYQRTVAWGSAASWGAGDVRRTIWESPRFQVLVQWLLRVASWVLLAAFTYQWLVFVLLQFPPTRASGEHLGASLPDLVVASLIFVLARVVTGVLGPIFDRAEHGQGQFGGSEGTIVDMGSFTTRIRTGVGEEIMSPR